MCQSPHGEVASRAGSAEVQHSQVIRHGSIVWVREVAEVDQVASVINFDSPPLAANLAHATVLGWWLLSGECRLVTAGGRIPLQQGWNSCPPAL